MVKETIIWRLVAGFCGSVVGLGLHPEFTSWARRATFMFSGVCCSFYFGAPIAAYFGLHEEGQLMAFSFAVAILWPAVIGKLSAALNGANIPFGVKK